MIATPELSPASLNGGFALIRDFDAIYDHFELRTRELGMDLDALRGEMSAALARATGTVLSIEVSDIHALALPIDPETDFVVTLDGGILFPKYDFRIEITRACSKMSAAMKGPYMRLSRQFAPLLRQQAITMRNDFQKSGKKGIVLCDDGIGTGQTFKSIIQLCGDLGVPVLRAIAITNPSNLTTVDGVEVFTLDPDKSQLAWLNERDLFWGLPRSGISVSEPDQFRAIGGIPYTLNEQMAHSRIGVRDDVSRAFVEEALEINERFMRLHEHALDRPLLFQEISRLSCLRQRGTLKEERVAHSLAALRQSFDYRNGVLAE